MYNSRNFGKYFLDGDNFKDYFVSVEIMTAVTDVVRAGGANVSLQFSIV